MALPEKSVNWIDEYSKGVFQLFAGNVIEGFQPIDFFHFLPLWYDLWIDRIAKLIQDNGLEVKSYQELKAILPPPSNMRAILQKIVPSYKGFAVKNKENIRIVSNFFGRMLIEACPSDPFALTKNQVHSAGEINEIVSKLQLENASLIEARKISQLITAAGSLVHGLYNDLTTDLGWEAFGPYVYKNSGEEYSLLIRWFPNMQPIDLWPANYLLSRKEILIYTLYQGVEWQISFVGCHTIALSGSPVQGMKKFVVIADGKVLTQNDIDELIEELSSRAVAVYQDIRSMDFEQLKLKVQLQETYQLKNLFDAYAVDWRPTAEMIARIQGKELLKNILPHGVMLNDQTEFNEVFGINKFKEEILAE